MQLIPPTAVECFGAQKTDSHFKNTQLPLNEDGNNLDKQLSDMNYKETLPTNIHFMVVVLPPPPLSPFTLAPMVPLLPNLVPYVSSTPLSQRNHIILKLTLDLSTTLHYVLSYKLYSFESRSLKFFCSTPKFHI